MTTGRGATHAVDTLRGRFHEEGLPEPPLPDELAASLREYGPWTFGTRPPPTSLYRLQSYLDEPAQSRADDYLLLGLAGHGLESQALHYYLVRGPLAVFVQSRWGTAYRLRADESEAIRRRFAGVARLLDATAEPAAGFERIRVVVSDFAGQRWDVDGRRPEGASADALGDALAWLTRPEEQSLA
jgi:hypothetical protein